MQQKYGIKFNPKKLVMKKKIDRNMTLKEILEIKGAEEILAKYNLPCLSCPMAKLELDKLKIGQVADMYKLDLSGILKELNK